MQLDKIIAVRNNKTVFCDENRCYKVFGQDYSKSDVLGEALNQARAEETGLNIPKVLEVAVIEGKWTIVSEYIEGKPLSRLMKENPEKRNDYLRLFLNLQFEIFEKSCPLLCGMRENLARKISLSDVLENTKSDLLHRLYEAPDRKKLCHGDFNPSNVIVTPKNEPYIIDWPHASLGDPVADAARTYLSFRLDGDDDLGNGYMTLFLEKSGAKKQEVEFWIPILSAALSVSANEREKKALFRLIGGMNY